MSEERMQRWTCRCGYQIGHEKFTMTIELVSLELLSHVCPLQNAEDVYSQNDPYWNGPCEICGEPGYLQGHVFLHACRKHGHEVQLKGHGKGHTCCQYLKKETDAREDVE